AFTGVTLGSKNSGSAPLNFAACSGSPNAAKLSGAEPEFFEPKVTPVKADGNDTSLEVEVGQMVKNSLRHKTYVRLLNKKYNQLELAMGGR
ncbi:MAG: hypothetical protein GQ528_02965, partial [Woeseiaceae bacterium]|nr:hypothetical protein [Woeseiaceae bacterium]